MKVIICSAFILTITAQCYAESRIRIDHSNWTTHYGYEDQRGIVIKRDPDGTWRYQSLSNPDSTPKYSYSSSVNKQVYDSATQRTDSYSQQFEDRSTNIPVQPTPSNRPRQPTNNMDQRTERNVPLQQPTNQQQPATPRSRTYNYNQRTEPGVPLQRPTNQQQPATPRSPTYNYNQRTEPGVPLQRPVNQPNYPHNPTTEPTRHRVSEFPEQQEQLPSNGNTVVSMVDDNSNVIMYNTNSLPFYQQTHTSSGDNLFGFNPRPTYRSRTYEPRPTFQPIPPPFPTYQPDPHLPTYDGSNGGVYVSQSVNTGGPFPNYVHNYVHVPL